MKITQFFNTDYVDQASYDNLRKIASVIDGQKNAARKILYTVLEKNINQEIKVSQLGSKVAEFSEYLHGSLDGVIVGLAKNYSGTNNIPLLVREGNFGTRFANEASASRYIYSNGSKEFFELFKKEDNDILIKQYFEGGEIEPMFYVPTLPMLLINGSEGVSSGFAQKILPRNPKKVKKYILDYINGEVGKFRHSKTNSLEPYYEGFSGEITQGEHSNQWNIKGVVEKIRMNKVLITEVPIGYDLKSYIKVLDDLEDKNVIQSYKDLSENDDFKFEVQMHSKTLKEMSNEELLNKLKLIKRVSENYTVIDENNKIVVYENSEQLMQHFIKVKLDFLSRRKKYLLSKIEKTIELDRSKYIFIKMIVQDELKINKRKKDDIISDIEKIKDIVKKDDSYDYLLNMSIHSLTEERMAKLELDIEKGKNELLELTSKSIENIWMDDLK